MEAVEILRWTVRFDPERTRRAYASIAEGGPEACGCEPCLNFAAARDQAYPPEFLSLLERLGVDPHREAEVFHTHRREDGLHHYGGWFHVVGEIVSGADAWREVRPNTRTAEFEALTETFSIGVTAHTALVDEAFGDLPRFQLEFEAAAPWVSSAPEPE